MRKKKWVRPFLDENTKYQLNKLPHTDKPIYLEIGMGMGDFICDSAKANQEIFYIGLEKDETCVARAIKKAQEYELNNFGIFLIDATNLLEYIGEKKIDRIYLHFSDPWPKKAHHKRRLTYPTFLELYKKILKDNGEIILKTDNIDLFNDSLEYFETSNYNLIKIDRDYDSTKLNEPMTGYQRRFIGLGQPIFFAEYRIK